MATTGSITGSSVNGWYLRLDYSITQSVANNTSTVAMTLNIYNGTGNSYNQNANSCYYSIYDSGKVYNPYTYSSTGWYTLGSYTKTIAHGSDGTKTVTLSGAWHAGFTSSYTPADLSVSGSVTLPTIPRASTLTAPTLTMGTAGTLTISRASSSFTHTITYSFGGTTGTIATKTSSTSVSWTPPTSLGARIPSATSGTVTFTLQTYSGSTLVGTSTKTATLKVPSYTPSVSLSVTRVNSNSTINRWGVAVKGYTKLSWTVTASSSYGATIAKYAVSIAGQSGSAASGTTGVLNISGSTAPSVTVTDSRGRTATAAAGAITVYAYANPSITSGSAFRSDSGGAASDDGAYLQVLCAGAVSSVGGHNSRTVRQRHRAKGGSWSGYTTLTNNTARTIDAGLSATSSYEVELSVTDTLGNAASVVYQIPTSAVTFHLRAGGGGAAFGKYAEFDDALDIGDWSMMGRVLGLGRARASIPANADLDGYREPGVYGVTSSATAATLRNCPSALAGTLRVWNATGDSKSPGATWYYVVQEYVNFRGYIWRRYGNAGADGSVFTWDASGWHAALTELNTADHVVEQGTSGGWTYRKWASGTCELWGRFTVTPAEDNVANGVHYSETIYVTTPFGVSGGVLSGLGATLFYTLVNGSVNAGSQNVSFRLQRATGAISTGTATAVHLHLCGTY